MLRNVKLVISPPSLSQHSTRPMLWKWKLVNSPLSLSQQDPSCETGSWWIVLSCFLNKAHVEKVKIAELSNFTFSTRSLPTYSRDFLHSLQSRQQYLSAPVNNMNCPLRGNLSAMEIDFEITWIFPRLNCRSSSPSELSWDKVIISILLREDWSAAASIHILGSGGWGSAPKL